MKPTHDQARTIVLQFAQKRAPRPILVGEATLLLGPPWSLTATEGLFLFMALRGDIRPLTRAEKKRYDMRTGWTV